MSASRIAAIILAAGEGRRLGGPKALLTTGGVSFLALVCDRFLSAGLDLVVAVLGAEANRVRAEAGLADGVSVVVNESWRGGMLLSIWCALDAVEALDIDAVLVHPVDNPLVSATTVAAVAASARSGAIIAVPTCDGRRGHPAAFARASWPALRAASPQTGARALLVDRPDWVTHIPAGADCLIDIDTADSYRSHFGVLPSDESR